MSISKDEELNMFTGEQTIGFQMTIACAIDNKGVYPVANKWDLVDLPYFIPTPMPREFKNLFGVKLQMEFNNQRRAFFQKSFIC